MLPRAHYRLLEKLREGFPDGKPEGRGIAAVSGGSDSIALLALLAAARERDAFEFTALYVDHGLRIAAAFEAALVCATATKLGVRFQWASCAPAGASEEALRDARYDAVARVTERIGADWIATAHTRDDHIETIVFRFLRGSGRGGLAGIPSTRGNIIRPLIGVGREELRDFLRACGLAWTEDPSNRDLRYARNRLRHVVLPTIARELGPGRLEHLPDVARVWSLENDYLETEAARFQAYATRSGASGAALDLAAFDTAPVALRTRVLRRWLQSAGYDGEPGISALEAIARLALSREGAAEIAIEGATVAREYATLELEPQRSAEQFTFTVRTDAAANYSDPAGEWTVSVDPQPPDTAPIVSAVGFQVVEFAKEALPPWLELRTRRVGDAIRTAPRGTRKVHDIMVELRVPRRAREAWPVLALNDAVIWVPGLAVSSDMESACRSESAERVRFAWRRSRV